MSDDQWLRYARNLGFPDSHYDEAVKLIGAPSNANQFLDALIDVSDRHSSSDADHKSSQTYLADSLAPVNESDDTKSLASSSSCYSSITSVPSPPDNLRRIFIDGPNVARSHGKDATFSWLGIRICVDWFLAREHRVKVFVPSDRCSLAEPSIIEYLNDHDALIRTPTGCNDDLFVIEAAMQSNAIIVSNDLFRDESRFINETTKFIRQHRLPYIFVDDLFIPAKDPLGKTGPNLDEFLRQTCQTQDNFHNKLNRTKSHQRSGPPVKQNQSSHKSLQASRSLPIHPPIGGVINASFNLIPKKPCSNVVASESHRFATDKCPRHQLKQSLHKSVSVVYMHDKDGSENSGRQITGPLGKQALCRTKSHNI